MPEARLQRTREAYQPIRTLSSWQTKALWHIYHKIVEEPDYCLFCNDPLPDNHEHYPYCSATCAVDAENDR